MMKIANFLKGVERIGNKLPDITTLFLFALILILLLSFSLSFVDFHYYLIGADGSQGEKIAIKNYLALPNFLELVVTSTKNFINFPPLAVTLVVALGIGVAESSGFLRVLLSKLASLTPKSLVVPMVLLLSVASHIVGDGAYVFLMPIAAVLFLSAGRHPVAGIATAFAGLAGGFSASFTPSIIDPIMQDFTEKAAHIVDKSVEVNVLCNYFVSLGGIVGVVVFCWYVCDKIVEPFLQKNLPIDSSFDDESFMSVSAQENKAFWYAMLSVVALSVVLVVLAYPSDSLLRGKSGILTSRDAVMMKALVPLMFIYFALPGFIYGKVTGAFPTFKEVFSAMTDSLKPLVGFITFCFVCGQFLYVFNHSNISKLIALSGADLLKSMGMPSGITILGLIILTAILNLFITSATSKWAVLAPIFVPMLMLLGISPELTQAAFRVSDSAINVMTPLFAFYPLIISYCQRYCSQTGVGTLSSIMLPFSIALLLALTITLYLFWWLGIPLGFESSYIYPRG